VWAEHKMFLILKLVVRYGCEKVNTVDSDRILKQAVNESPGNQIQ
jgi:hypothetical protein